MNSIDLQTITSQSKEQNQKEIIGTELGNHGSQILTASVTKQTINQIISQLPPLARSQMNCVNTLLHPLEDLNQLTQIYDAIDQFKLLLQTPATLVEVDSLISLVFTALPSHNKNEEDIINEKKLWIKFLEGQPYWAIESACCYISKNKKWRIYAELEDAVLKETKDLRLKILVLKQLAEVTEKEFESKTNSSSHEEFVDSLEKASKEGNKFAKLILNKQR